VYFEHLVTAHTTIKRFSRGATVKIRPSIHFFQFVKYYLVCGLQALAGRRWQAGEQRFATAIISLSIFATQLSLFLL
jgi:hypothetical protein